VLSIETGICRDNCDSLLTLFGNGNLAYSGSYTSPSGVTVIGKNHANKNQSIIANIAKSGGY
jgi:hypothetical protein